MFQILGIEETRDLQVIKDAYRKKLAQTNPEDDPEGFKRLRRAYEEACAHAKEPEGESEEQTDDTPSGLWMERVAKVYADIVKRQDVSCWQELFNDDVFLSLEDEENCRSKLLYFLMRNFKLPTDIWKLLDKKLNIVSDAAKLRESLPVDFVRYMVSKCERGEDLDFTQFEGEPEAPYDLYLQYYDRCWNALQEKKLDEAQECIDSAEKLSVFHPVMEVCRAHLMVERGQVEEAIQLMRKLHERYPLDAMVCYNTAESLWNHGKKDEAAQIYISMREENESHYMANFRLTEWYYERKQYDEAKKCAEKVLSAGADDSFMELLAKINHEIEKGLEERYFKEQDVGSGLELGWCYLQDGRVSRGIQVAEALQGRVPAERDSEHKGLLTKLYVEETEYEEALQMAEEWRKALQLRLDSDQSEEEKERDRDRVRQYHVIRMQIWRAQGDMLSRKPEERRRLYEMAIEEAQGLLDNSLQDIGLLLETAQIYMEMEEYDRSLEVTGKLIEEYQVYAAYATEVEVYRRQRIASGVIQAGRSCIQYFPGYVRAYERMGRVYFDLGQKEQLEELFAEAEANHVESVVLDAYRYLLTHKALTVDELDEKVKEFRNTYGVRNVSTEKYHAGLPVITEYLYSFPGAYMLVERGIFHSAARQYEAAKADLEKVLAEDPCHPYALNSLSFVYRYTGDYEKALIYLKRALRYRDEEMSPSIYQNIADLYSLLGNDRKALEYTRRYADNTSYETAYHLGHLAVRMARCGDMEGAVALVNKVQKNDLFDRFEDTVDLCQMSGDRDQARAQIEAWETELGNFTNIRQTHGWRVSFLERNRRLHIRKAWQDMLYGDGSRAVKYFEQILKPDEKLDEETRQDYLCDGVFTCILCKDERRGQKFASEIRKSKSNSHKKDIYREFFSLYYKETEEVLERILDGEDQAEVCRACTNCICRDLEAGRIFLMLRKGQEKEAFERLQKDLELLPTDKYLLAISHMCVERHVKITVEGTGILSRIRGIFGLRK